MSDGLHQVSLYARLARPRIQVGDAVRLPGIDAALDKVDGTPTAACCPWCVAGRLS